MNLCHQITLALIERARNRKFNCGGKNTCLPRKIIMPSNFLSLFLQALPPGSPPRLSSAMPAWRRWVATWAVRALTAGVAAAAASTTPRRTSPRKTSPGCWPTWWRITTATSAPSSTSTTTWPSTWESRSRRSSTWWARIDNHTNTPRLDF